MEPRQLGSSLLPKFAIRAMLGKKIMSLRLLDDQPRMPGKPQSNGFQ